MSTEDLFKLEKKRALVVGGGRNMGNASAELLAIVGAEVVVLDIDERAATAVAAAIVETGGRAVPLVGDVLDPDAAAAAVEEAARLLGGGLDVLVNIVGAPAWAPALEMSVDTWDAEQIRNLRYVFTVSQAFARLPAARDAARAIVSITSISGMNSAPKHVAYGAAKAGLMSLVRTLAQEWGALGIRVNCVAPGAIRTDRPGKSDIDAIVTPSAPMGRRGDVTEIAKTVLFLASDLASYVTGQVIAVDGGLQTNFPFPIASMR